MRIVSKKFKQCASFVQNNYLVPSHDFRIQEMLVSLREKFFFSVSRCDIFDWSHDWSTIQFSQFTGQTSVKLMLPIPRRSKSAEFFKTPSSKM